MGFRHTSDALFRCPKCGKENTAHETFRCRRCGKQYLCADHLNPHERVCEDCVSMKKKDSGIEPGMVIVHEGEFFMGMDDDEDAVDAAPLHPVRIEQYLIDKDPVSNADFIKFRPEHTYPEGKDNEPVVNVTFNEAKEYAEWAGKRLPTEAEWEKAARSRDKRLYPWGKDLPEDAIKEAGGDVREGLKKFNLSPYRVREMVGGPWEWCDTEYGPYPDGNTAIPAFLEGNKVIRGGEIGIGIPAKTYSRSYANPLEAREDITFRCVKDAKLEYDTQYAGAEIKRTKKKESEFTPPPEFKKFKTSKEEADTVKHVDYMDLRPKDMIKAAKETDRAIAKGEAVPGQTPSVKPSSKPVVKQPVKKVKEEDEWKPEKPKSPVGIIIAIVVVVIIVGAYLITKTGGAKAGSEVTKPAGSTASAQAFESPRTMTVKMSKGNVIGATTMMADPGDKITISVIGAPSTGFDPPLMAMIGNGAEIKIGATKTITADAQGEIKLIYKGDTVAPPTGMQLFEVLIKLEKKVKAAEPPK